MGSDLISRAEALRAVEWSATRERALDYLKDLPSTPHDPDAISGRAVIGVINKLAAMKFSLSDEYQIYLHALMDVDERVRKLPSIYEGRTDNE